jgi:hypothetical protein
MEEEEEEEKRRRRRRKGEGGGGGRMTVTGKLTYLVKSMSQQTPCLPHVPHGLEWD